MLGLAARGLGFLRDVFVAARFGAGPETDALFLVQALWLQLTSFVAGAIPPILVPRIAEARRTGDDRHLGALLGGSLAVLGGASAVLAAVVGFAPQPILSAFAPGLPPERLQLAASLLLWIVHALPLGVAVGVLQSAAQQRGQYGWGEASQLLVAASAIAGLWLFAPAFGVHSVHMGLAVGVALQAGVMGLWMWREGIRPRWPERGRKLLSGLAAAVALSVLLSWSGGYLSMLVDRAFSARLAEGELSAQAYAMRVAGLVSQVFGGPLTTVLLTALAGAALREGRDDFHRMAETGFRITLYVVSPILLYCAVAAEPVVALVFGRGAFTADHVALTAALLLWVAPSTALDMLRGTVATAFFGAGRPKLAFVLGTARIVGSLLLYPFVWRRWGVMGLSAGLCLLNVVLLVFALALARGALAIPVRPLFVGFGSWLVGCGLALSGAAMVLGAVDGLSLDPGIRPWVEVGASGFVFVATLASWGPRAGPVELRQAVSLVKDRVMRRRALGGVPPG